MLELLDRLEAAENAKNDWLYANAPGGWIDNLRINLDDHRALVFDLRKEVEKLRTKIKQMEKQEPVALVKWQVGGQVVHLIGDVKPGDLLYTLPGAKGEEK